MRRIKKCFGLMLGLACIIGFIAKSDKDVYAGTELMNAPSGIMSWMKSVVTTELGGLEVSSTPNEMVQTLNNNIPFFTEADKATGLAPLEAYSKLDALGRCGVAFAHVGKETMPTEERGEIGHIKPTGWHTVKYPSVIKDRYLYNRCHLIAFCLAGENDNPKNLITGTRSMNVDGMEPYELKVLDYVRKTGNHVLYRVTPNFIGDNLVADGVQMEAWSVEDAGKGICFCVYVRNIQPGVEIDYSTGESKLK